MLHMPFIGYFTLVGQNLGRKRGEVASVGPLTPHLILRASANLSQVETHNSYLIGKKKSVTYL